MSLVGYEVFYTDPGVTNEIGCKVCGTICLVMRNDYGPTGFASAWSHRYVLHDTFRCPHTGKDWHNQALALVQELQETQSRQIGRIIRRDLKEILKRNGGKAVKLKK